MKISDEAKNSMLKMALFAKKHRNVMMLSLLMSSNELMTPYYIKYAERINKNLKILHHLKEPFLERLYKMKGLVY